MPSTNPFSLASVPKNAGLRSKLLSCFAGPLQSILGLNELAALYDRASVGGEQGFAARTLEQFEVSYELLAGSLDYIPKEGPVVVVANHPFGGIEGVILADLLRRVRPDTKIMANALLSRIPELRDHFILVDPFGGKNSQRKNIEPLREALDWVKKGGLLAVFPAGTVSHFQWKRREISDPAWSDSIGRIVKKTGASVVPMHFCGRNGPLFNAAGLVHPLLRTVLLPREMLKRRQTCIRLKVGKPIANDRLVGFPTVERLTAYLRLRSYILAEPKTKALERLSRWFAELREKYAHQEPVIKETAKEDLAKEISLLPEHQKLVEADDYIVYSAAAAQIPYVLREIGRLREITFREAKEGTGRSIDLDRFDSYYIHLFVWNKDCQEIVGAYRLGKTDWIVRRFGKRGLYTSTLFRYRSRFLSKLHPALELGRSFVRKEYQRSYAPLLLLWKGIGQYVVRNPRYRILFGPVSISNEYESLSRQLITSFLQANSSDPRLSRFIKAKNPLRRKRISGVDNRLTGMIVRDLEDITDLISEIETKEKKIPVLLRQYLRLGGKILGFNVDPKFASALDGLLVVDLTDTEPKLLERYLGKGAHDFLEFHRKRRRRRGCYFTEELPPAGARN